MAFQMKTLTHILGLILMMEATGCPKTFIFIYQSARFTLWLKFGVYCMFRQISY